MESSLTSGILTSLPGRYAKALFDLAKEHKQVDGIAVSLNSLSALIQSSGDLHRALANPTIGTTEQTAVLKKICKQMKASTLFQSFLEHLVNARRILYLAKINEIYQDLVILERGEEKVEIISAHPLTKSQVTLLKDKLKKVFPRTLSLTFTNDANVLGGVMVRVGCRVIDATLITQLNHLATVLKGKA